MPMPVAVALAAITLAACSTSAGVSQIPSASGAPLDPTAVELALLAGARQDLQGTCAPQRAALPAGVRGAVVCRPPSDVVEVVRLSMLDSRHELMDAYLGALAAKGVSLRAGGGPCGPGRPTEGAYVPGDDGTTLVHERQSCSVDAGRQVHVVATLPPLVLAEVEGRVDDPEEVVRFAWLGNQDQPGGPTIWNEHGPLSPEK